MIDTLLKIIDRLLVFREKVRERKQAVFKDLVEPTFSELSEIHNNYLTQFVEAKEMCLNNQTLEPTLAFLNFKQMEFAPVRDKLAALATVLKDSRQIEARGLHDTLSFFESVSDYFPTGDLIIGGGTAWASLIQVLEAHHSQQLNDINGNWLELRDMTPPECIDLFVKHQREKWRKVSYCYAILKEQQLS